jgi:uncharacterized membrane protein YqjE
MKTFIPLLILIVGALVLYAIQIQWGLEKHVAWTCVIALIILGSMIRGWVIYKSK